MSAWSLVVTAPDGTAQTYPLTSGRYSIGRDGSNAIVVTGVGVSAFHCELEVTPSGCILQDRASTNGTWVNGSRVTGPTSVGEEINFWVGPCLLHVTPAAAIAPPAAAAEVAVIPPTGPILRMSGPERAWRDQHAQILRYAQQWDRGSRIPRLLLSTNELRRAQVWIASPPPTVADEIGRLEREFVAASTSAAKRRGVVKIAYAAIVTVIAATTAPWALRCMSRDDSVPVAPAEPTAPPVAAHPEPGPQRPAAPPPPPTPAPDPDRPIADTEGPIEHTVIINESLPDVAKRYGVSENDLLSWNLINPDAPLVPGQVLLIKKPKLRPLPQQRIEVVLERNETYKDIARRFGLSVTDLRTFNPTIHKPKTGDQIVLWVDPKPYRPRQPQQPIPEFHIDQRAQSVGSPNSGQLENGVLLPESTNYYRISGAQWGSAYAISNLQSALAHFRQDVDYEGLIIVADMSKRGGGFFAPHKSHQAGRDVDIWLPSVRGVYRPKAAAAGGKKLHRPIGEEIDWYATWGLARALIRTGAIEAIYLDWSRQIYVYNAARNMGATAEELDQWLQYPRSKSSSKGIFRHSAEHYTHIHVRFRCAPWETQCRHTAEHPGD